MIDAAAASRTTVEEASVSACSNVIHQHSADWLRVDGRADDLPVR